MAKKRFVPLTVTISASAKICARHELVIQRGSFLEKKKKKNETEKKTREWVKKPYRSILSKTRAYDRGSIFGRKHTFLLDGAP